MFPSSTTSRARWNRCPSCRGRRGQWLRRWVRRRSRCATVARASARPGLVSGGHPPVSPQPSPLSSRLALSGLIGRSQRARYFPNRTDRDHYTRPWAMPYQLGLPTVPATGVHIPSMYSRIRLAIPNMVVRDWLRVRISSGVRWPCTACSPAVLVIVKWASAAATMSPMTSSEGRERKAWAAGPWRSRSRKSSQGCSADLGVGVEGPAAVGAPPGVVGGDARGMPQPVHGPLCDRECGPCGGRRCGSRARLKRMPAGSATAGVSG